MNKGTKISLPDVKPIKRFTSGFLFNEEEAPLSPIPNSNELSDENIKDIEATLQDSLNNNKKDIEETNKKIEELNKVISITTDSLKRNYLSAQLKDKKNSLLKKKELMKNQEENLKKQEEEKNKPDIEKAEVKAILGTDSANSNISASLNMEGNVNKIRKMMNELINRKMINKNPVQKNPIQHKPTNSLKQIPQPVKRKSFKVVFDKSTKPWEVVFSERGFLVGGTRLSFENIEVAIDKKFNIFHY